MFQGFVPGVSDQLAATFSHRRGHLMDEYFPHINECAFHSPKSWSIGESQERFCWAEEALNVTALGCGGGEKRMGRGSG